MHSERIWHDESRIGSEVSLHRSESNAARGCGSATSRGVLCLLAALLWETALPAQTPEEHASHHPAAAVAGAIPAAPGAAPAMGAMPAAAGSAAPGGMGSMMEGMMGAAPPKELYPSLMALPELSPEQRKQVDEQANERMHSGSVLMGQAFDSLTASAQSGDYAGMHEAMTRLREGTAQLDSGIAARRALAEGRAPRAVALAWFRQEMNLASPLSPEEPYAIFGVTPFHLFTMVLLVGFAITMVAMYFFKMRRAAALFGRLDSDSGRSPPGASPPLAGRPGPSPPVAPPPEKGPQPDKPTSPPTPAAEAPPASDQSPAGPAGVLVSESASPLTANWKGRLRIGSIVAETPSVKTFRLLPSSDDCLLPFTFVPGQFLNVAFCIGGARMNRSYSISSSPTQREYVELTVRREPRGAVSRHIVDLLKVGDEIEAGGPVGKFTFTGTETDNIVLISGGVGITPMVSIARYLTERSWAGDIFFIYICRTPADFILADEVAALQHLNPKLHVAVTMTRAEGTDWKGPRGHLTKELLTQTVPNLASRRIHVCGPLPMMDSTKALLAELGVPSDHVKTEAFGAVKPPPAAAGTIAQPTAPATGPMVTFSKHNKSANIHTDQTVLELSEELGIGIENSCRVGTCGICKVKMTSGEVEMAVEDSLDPDEKANGIILACQAKPKMAIAVEA